MRFIVELAPAADGRVEGSLGCDGVEGVIRFSGWLELLRLLEVHAVPAPGVGERAAKEMSTRLRSRGNRQ